MASGMGKKEQEQSWKQQLSALKFCSLDAPRGHAVHVEEMWHSGWRFQQAPVAIGSRNSKASTWKDASMLTHTQRCSR